MAKTTLRGADVEIVYMNCDTLAKTESIDVYLMKPGGNKWPKMLGWLHGRTLAFRYDPAGTEGPDAPKPSVTEGPNGLLISVAHLSSVQVKTDKWSDIPITYRIARQDYP